MAAALSASTCLSFSTSANSSIFISQKQRTSGVVSLSLAKTGGFSSLRTSRFRVVCAAKPETVEKVCEIVKKQLALAPESVLTPDTSFSALGADSLDTVEIVMELEGAFDINVEEENSENITTVQEAADLIDKLVQKKAEEAAA